MDALALLTLEQRRYVAQTPSYTERREQDIDGSEMELQIATTLLRAGRSEDEGVSLFDQWGLPRHEEDKAKEGHDGATRSRFEQAASSIGSYSADEQPEEEATQHHPRVIENEHTPLKRSYDSNRLRVAVLRRRREAEEAGEPLPILATWRQEIIAVSEALGGERPVSLATARRLSKKLSPTYVVLEPGAGNRKYVRLTERGRKASTSGWSGFQRTVSVRSAAASGAAERPSFESVLVPDVVSESEAVIPRAKKPRKPRSAESKRRQYVRSYRRNNLINSIYRLSFAGARIRFFQFLTPADQWLTGEVFERLPIGYDEDGLAHYATIWDDGPSVRELVGERLGWRYQSKTKTFAAAVEVSEDGGICEQPDDQGIFRPCVGLVVQSASNFFVPLTNGNLDQRMIRVRGTGRNKPRTDADQWRTYSFEDGGPQIPLNVTFDFETALQTFDAHQRALDLSPLPQGWFRMPEQRQRLVQRLLAQQEPASATIG